MYGVLRPAHIRCLVSRETSRCLGSLGTQTQEIDRDPGFACFGYRCKNSVSLFELEALVIWSGIRSTFINLINPRLVYVAGIMGIERKQQAVV